MRHPVFLTTFPAMRTTGQHLADLMLGRPVEDWITDRRRDRRHWYEIADELSQLTGGKVAVTERTLRNWTSQPGEAASA